MQSAFPRLDDRSSGVRPFLDLSARLGRDSGMIQASGGNTSIKEGGRLWIKASGKVLAAARSEEIFVALDLDAVRGAIRDGAEDPVSAHVIGDPGLRPSIETSLHALMPHRYVFHVHSVDVLAWAVREDGEEAVSERMKGLRWGWVPYARPGVPLTRAVASVAAEKPDFLVLGNHGLVVGGDTCAEIEQRIETAVGRLRAAARPYQAGPKEILDAWIGSGAFRLPADDRVHALGRDGDILEMARRGVLYPDHVVFLGPVLPVADPAADVEVETARYVERFGNEPPAVVVAGVGVLLAGASRFGVEEMLLCLVDVLARVAPGTGLRYLADTEIAELLNWDAEKYRRALYR